MAENNDTSDSINKTNTHCKWCAAINCANSKLRRPDLSFHFHLFPSDPERCKQWIINSKRLDLESKTPEQLHKGTALCSEHFEPCCFSQSAKKQRRLLSHAVPTIFSVPNICSKHFACGEPTGEYPNLMSATSSSSQFCKDETGPRPRNKAKRPRPYTRPDKQKAFGGVKIEIDADPIVHEPCQSDQCDLLLELEVEKVEEVVPVPVYYEHNPNYDTLADENDDRQEANQNYPTSTTFSLRELPAHLAKETHRNIRGSPLCTHAACMVEKRKLRKTLKRSRWVEKQLKKRIGYLHSIANIDLGLLSVCLNGVQIPQVQEELQKLITLVQALLSDQMWDIRSDRVDESSSKTLQNTGSDSTNGHGNGNENNPSSSSRDVNNKNNIDSSSNNNNNKISDSSSNNISVNNTYSGSSIGNNVITINDSRVPGVDLSKIAIFNVTNLPPGLSFINNTPVYNIGNSIPVPTLNANAALPTNANAGSETNANTISSIPPTETNTILEIHNNNNTTSSVNADTSSQMNTSTSSTNVKILSPITINTTPQVSRTSSINENVNTAPQMTDDIASLINSVAMSQVVVDFNATHSILQRICNTTSQITANTSSSSPVKANTMNSLPIIKTEPDSSIPLSPPNTVNENVTNMAVLYNAINNTTVLNANGPGVSNTGNFNYLLPIVTNTYSIGAIPRSRSNECCGYFEICTKSRNKLDQSEDQPKSPKRRVLCELCGNWVVGNNCSCWHFQSHMRRAHTGEKPFKCEQCSKEFHDTQEMKSHLKYYHNERPFQCEECGKKLKTIDTLKYHWLVHSTEGRNIPCSDCDTKFKRLDCLKNHMKAKHNKAYVAPTPMSKVTVLTQEQ